MCKINLPTLGHHASFNIFITSTDEYSPLYGEVIVALSLRGNVLPQLAGRQAGPRRVVSTTWDTVATFAVFAA